MLPEYERYIQSDNTIDVVCSSHAAYWELFFGPTLPNARPFICDETNIGEILVKLGLVQSKSWCRKNNWYKELEPGYQEIVFGSKRVKLCLLIRGFNESAEPLS